MKRKKSIRKDRIDEVKVKDNKAKTSVNGTVCMYVKHSWYVAGKANQNVTIEQTLSNDVVEYIRNRKDNQNRGVCFSFWYKPDDALSNG